MGKDIFPSNLEKLGRKESLGKGEKWRKTCSGVPGETCEDTTQWYCIKCYGDASTKEHVLTCCANHQYLHWKLKHKVLTKGDTDTDTDTSQPADNVRTIKKGAKSKSSSCPVGKGEKKRTESKKNGLDMEPGSTFEAASGKRRNRE